MSYGYTGMIFNYRAKLGLFNRVKVYALEGFETSNFITSTWHLHHVKKFKKRFTALRYIVKINKL